MMLSEKLDEHRRWATCVSDAIMAEVPYFKTEIVARLNETRSILE